MATAEAIDNALRGWLLKYSEDQPRDADGKFGSGGGVGSAGGWTKETSAESHLNLERACLNQGMTQEATDRLMATAPPPTDTEKYTLAGGKATVTFWSGSNATDAQKEDLLGTAKGLAEKYPEKGVNLTVLGGKDFANFYNLSSGKTSVGGTIAFSEVGGKAITMNDRVFSLTSNDFDLGHFPLNGDATVASACLDHEFGHTIDAMPGYGEADLDHGHGTSIMDGLTSPSPYGQNSRAEGYAEAFAMFTLSGGKTTDPLAQALAKQDGWK